MKHSSKEFKNLNLCSLIYQHVSVCSFINEKLKGFNLILVTCGGLCVTVWTSPEANQRGRRSWQAQCLHIAQIYVG